MSRTEAGFQKGERLAPPTWSNLRDVLIPVFIAADMHDCMPCVGREEVSGLTQIEHFHNSYLVVNGGAVRRRVGRG